MRKSFPRTGGGRRTFQAKGTACAKAWGSMQMPGTEAAQYAEGMMCGARGCLALSCPGEPRADFQQDRFPEHRYQMAGSGSQHPPEEAVKAYGLLLPRGYTGVRRLN